MQPVLGNEQLDHITKIGGLGKQSLFGWNVVCKMETVLSNIPLTGGYTDTIFVRSTEAAASIVIPIHAIIIFRLHTS